MLFTLWCAFQALGKVTACSSRGLRRPSVSQAVNWWHAIPIRDQWNAWLSPNISRYCFFHFRWCQGHCHTEQNKNCFYCNKTKTLKNVSYSFAAYFVSSSLHPMFRKLGFQSYALLIYILLKVAWAHGKNMDFGIRDLNQILVQLLSCFWLWPKYLIFFNIVFLFLKWERYTLAGLGDEICWEEICYYSKGNLWILCDSFWYLFISTE